MTHMVTEDPKYPVSDWQHEVSNGDTCLGYYQWRNQKNGTLDTLCEQVVTMTNGNTLRCGEGEQNMWGGYVRICDQDGNEKLYWDSSEWRDDPEVVMGAIFAAAFKEL